MIRRQTRARCAPSRACRQPAARARIGRLALMVTLMMMTTIASAFGPPAQVGLAVQPEPIDRFQVVVKEVLVHDDHEGILLGKGEMDLKVSVRSCPIEIAPPCLAPRHEIGGAIHAAIRFDAGSKETVTLNRVVPADGDDTAGGQITPELGFPALPGYYNLVQFTMSELDSYTNNEPMGWVLHLVQGATTGEGIGTFRIRSLTRQGSKEGDYTITFEVRRLALPDVRPARIEISDLPNSPRKHVCTVVENIGAVEAGPFMVALYINGSDSEGGRPIVGSLGPGASTAVCVDTKLPQTGEYVLRAALDESIRLTELNEANNVLLLTRTAPPKPVGPDAQQAPDEQRASTPGVTQADLAVSTIKLNGQVPDGKSDCKDGKNAVVVLVKNAGTAAAGTFAVQLTVDGDASLTASVDGLEIGREREVRFEGVRLKKGEHKLMASADGAGAVVEARDDNNEEPSPPGAGTATDVPMGRRPTSRWDVGRSVPSIRRGIALTRAGGSCRPVSVASPDVRQRTRRL